MEGLRTPTLLSLALITAFLCLVPQGANGDCDLKSAEKGSDLCRKAFEETLDKNKAKVIDHPKKTGCCLSYNMGDCVKHAFSSAKCSPEDQTIGKLVEDKVEEAQSEINKGASYIGSFICGQQSRATCGHLVEEYDKAKEEISALNQAPSNSLVTPFLAIACSLLALLFS